MSYSLGSQFDGVDARQLQSIHRGLWPGQNWNTMDAGEDVLSICVLRCISRAPNI